jgi:diacylglycerol kinase (ATP)
MSKGRQQEHFSLPGLVKSFGYAAEGIAFALRTQRNARAHLLAAVLVCAAGLLLKVEASDWRWLAAAIALVWFSELMNTAFEYLCDVISPELHASVKRAKDIAAGAVLVCVIGAVAIGAITFWPYVAKLAA